MKRSLFELLAKYGILCFNSQPPERVLKSFRKDKPLSKNTSLCRCQFGPEGDEGISGQCHELPQEKVWSLLLHAGQAGSDQGLRVYTAGRGYRKQSVEIRFHMVT